MQGGKLRALAVSGAKRSDQVPDVPTVAEAGVKGFEFMLWFGVWGPSGMPANLVSKIASDINRVLAGDVYVSDKMSKRILEIFTGQRGNSSGSPVERLTDREFEVFQQIGEGKATRDIAGKLHLNVKTVEVHRLHIKEKLELKTAAELIHFAVRWVESREST